MGSSALVAAVIATTGLLTMRSANAQTYTWDPLQNGVQSDGSGTWDTTSSIWSNGSTDTTWTDNSGSDNATFGSSATTGNYTVTMSGNRAVPNIIFANGGGQYTLNGGGNTLNINYYPYFNGNTVLTNGSFVQNAGYGFGFGGILTLGPGSILNTAYIGLNSASTAIYFNGGTIAANTGNNYGYFGNTGTQYISSGGLTVDTTNAAGNYQGIYFNAGLAHDPNAAAIDGGLTKIGTGVLQLNASCTYTGATNVNGGTLELNVGGYQGVIPSGTSLNVNTGGTLYLNQSDALGYNGGAPNLTINGGTVTNTGTVRDTLQNFNMVGGTLTAPSGSYGDGYSGQYGSGGGNYSLNGPLINVSAAANGTPAVISAPFIALQQGYNTINVTRGTGAVDLTLSSTLLNYYNYNCGLIFSGNGVIDMTGTAEYSRNTQVTGATLILDQNQPQYGVIQNGQIQITNGGTVIVAGDNALIGYANGSVSVYVGTGSTLETAGNNPSTHAGNVQLDGGTLASPAGPIGGSAAYYGSFDFQPGAVLNVTQSSTATAQHLVLEPGSNAAYVSVSAGAMFTVSGYFANAGGTAAGLTENGAGTILLTGSNTYTGDTIVNGGTLEVGATGSINNTGNVTLASGTLLKVDFGGIVTPAGQVSAPSGATLTANGTIGGNYLVAGGVVNFGNNSSTGILVRTLSGLTINNVGVVTVAPAPGHGNRTLLVTSALSIGSAGGFTGSLDLSNNDMDVQNGNLANVTAAVGAGYNGGAWNGATGIMSSSAATNTRHLTALGVIQNSVNQNSGSALMSTFDGTTVGNTDVLVKYTYYGDTDLSGVVDGTDYSRVDVAYLADRSNPGSVTGWFNGDFNYDGTVDGSDYTLMDNAFNTQGASLAAALATPAAQIGAGSSSVPEPASLSLLAPGVTAALGRRRRR